MALPNLDFLFRSGTGGVGGALSKLLGPAAGAAEGLDRSVASLDPGGRGIGNRLSGSAPESAVSTLDKGGSFQDALSRTFQGGLGRIVPNAVGGALELGSALGAGIGTGVSGLARPALTGEFKSSDFVNPADPANWVVTKTGALKFRPKGGPKLDFSGLDSLLGTGSQEQGSGLVSRDIAQQLSRARAAGELGADRPDDKIAAALRSELGVGGVLPTPAEQEAAGIGRGTVGGTVGGIGGDGPADQPPRELAHGEIFIPGQGIMTAQDFIGRGEAAERLPGQRGRAFIESGGFGEMSGVMQGRSQAVPPGALGKGAGAGERAERRALEALTPRERLMLFSGELPGTGTAKGKKAAAIRKRIAAAGRTADRKEQRGIAAGLKRELATIDAAGKAAGRKGAGGALTGSNRASLANSAFGILGELAKDGGTIEDLPDDMQAAVRDALRGNLPGSSKKKKSKRPAEIGVGEASAIVRLLRDQGVPESQIKMQLEAMGVLAQ